ncbi:hypothetical protein [Clostridium botulinum]|uniref:hypothetical protein n=1 Tax=Clostridium botulinum TaxID=1491 RepID=UPI0006AC68F3|nr:hypothetical protein [Clostridium botulinum]KOR52868.1 hypothetical protein ADT23_07510 [Clostridium botulinum]NFN91463.1 hypothetical protein [Clostridium botulinum]
MSIETKNLKLFKYDREADDFNTTTFNIKKCLNDNWDKIDLQSENTQKDITEIKLKDENQDKLIQEAIGKLSFKSFKRDLLDTGYYKRVVWTRKDGTKFADSTLDGTTTSGEFHPDAINITFYNESGNLPVEKFSFKFTFDNESGDLIEARLM